MKKNRLFMMLGAVCLSMAMLAGCGSKKEAPVEEPKAPETVIETEAETVVETEAVDTFNTEGAAAFEALFEKAMTCVEEYDVEGFMELYRDAEDCEEQITSDFMYLSEYMTEMNEKSRYSILCGDGTYFAGYIMNYETEGKYPEAESFCNHMTVSLSCVNGEWLFDDTEAAAKAAAAYSASIYPDEMNDARKKSRNAADLSNGDYSWTDASMVLPEDLIGTVYLAWENQDGSISLLLNIKNGTATDIPVDSATIEVADAMYGELCTAEWKGATVKSYTSENFVINVPAADLEVEADEWIELDVTTTLNFK